MSTEPLLNGGPVATKTAPKRLGTVVVLYEPSSPRPATNTTSSTSTAPPPDVILFFGWMGAKTAHVVKYVAQYQILYPSAPILLIDAPVSYMFRRWLFGPAVQPVLTYVQSILGDTTTPTTNARPRILVHSCSNGGSALFLALLRRHLAQTKSAFPAHVVAFDSAPGVGNYKRMVLAMSAAAGTKTWWQRLLGLVFAHTSTSLLFAYIFVVRLLTGWPTHPFRHMWNSLADGAGVSRNERARLYLYSDGDELILSKDIEDHAEVARRQGMVVRMDKFQGSRHVAHARLDPERYWGAVRKLWESAYLAAVEQESSNGAAKK